MQKSALSTLLIGARTGAIMMLLVGVKHVLIMDLCIFYFTSPESVIQTCMIDNGSAQIVNVLNSNLVYM